MLLYYAIARLNETLLYLFFRVVLGNFFFQIIGGEEKKAKQGSNLNL